MTDISQKYQKLTEIEHVLARPGRYVGNINQITQSMWFIDSDGSIGERDFTFTPAFHKLFDEIITNSADHSKTPEGAGLTEIIVTVDAFDGIHVRDNGGIPVVKHPEYQQWIPEMIFGELRSGSNFDDAAENELGGQNGEGASLTNIFSKEFVVWTRHNNVEFKQRFSENMSKRSEPEIKDYKGKGFTSINWVVDFPRFGMTEITNDDLLLMKRRTYEIAFTNPKLKVHFNGELCSINNFKSFVELWGGKPTYQEIDRWRVGVGFSKTGFRHLSYVNSIPSGDGGSHVEYVTEKIVDLLREKIEKKTKQKIRPSDIKNNLMLFLDCNIINPRYHSQTKEKLITPISQFGSKFEITDKFEKELLSSKMVEDIIAWALHKTEMEEIKKLEEEAKDIKRKGFHDIPKYNPATSSKREECTLFLTEGDSAQKPFTVAADPKIHGVFPLRGKPKNCFAEGIRDVISTEILYISTILNLSITDPDYTQMRYGKVVIATDADDDGIHIRGLLLLFFKKFWPELLLQGKVFFLESPKWIVTYKGQNYDFRDNASYYEFVKDKPSVKTHYCKGLGSHETEKFEEILKDPSSYVRVDYFSDRDDDSLHMVFDPKRSDDRKEWVAL